ncbi:MAG: hypothetical protein F6K18_04465 [Okeania sp. SIO2C2]|nr:hypothetical protein [Okeania sp. SIO2C2]
MAKRISRKIYSIITFSLANGTEKRYPIIFQIGRYLYYWNEYFQAVRLPYKGGLASMYIFLPKKQVGLERFYQVLNEENWKSWMKQLKPDKIDLGLPKFKMKLPSTMC